MERSYGLHPKAVVSPSRWNTACSVTKNNLPSRACSQPPHPRPLSLLTIPRYGPMRAPSKESTSRCSYQGCRCVSSEAAVRTVSYLWEETYTQVSGSLCLDTLCDTCVELKKHRTNLAQSSPILRLPPEVRNRVYEFVLGGELLHIGVSWNTKDNRAACRRTTVTICKADVDDCEAAATIRASVDVREIPSYAKRHRKCKNIVYGDRMQYSNITRLLQTCRQIHEEAALLPFQANTFDFESKESLMAFQRMTLRIQQRAVQTFSLSPCSLGERSSIVAAFKGLQILQVFLKIPPAMDPNCMEVQAGILRHYVGVFRSLKLTSATVCIYESGDVCRYHGTANTRPEPLNELSAELEAKLLA